MSDEPQVKRAKQNVGNKNPNNFKRHGRKYLEAGHKGFLATCNFREKDCVRECYNILNTYADEYYGPTNGSTSTDSRKSPDEIADKDDDDVEEEEDISSILQKEIKATINAGKLKEHRFHQVETGASNFVFIKTSLADPVELGAKIVRDIAANKKRLTRFLLRLVPIEIVCKANIEDIKNAAGILFDKYFLNTPPKTFSIVINRRYNNSIDRDKIINELAELVMFKNVNHKVDLKHAETSIIVEIVKGLCCLSVVPHYLQLKKYNVLELGIQKPDKEGVERKVEPVVELIEDDKSKEEHEGKAEPVVEPTKDEETKEE